MMLIEIFLRHLEPWDWSVYYLDRICILSDSVDLLFVLLILLLCLLIGCLEISHLSSGLIILGTLGRDLRNDLLKIFLL